MYRSLLVVQYIQGVPKKRDLRILILRNDLCSQYFIHVANKYRSGIFMILAFHGIFHFYSTPFRSLAVVPQRTSLLTSPAVIFYLYSNVLKKSDQVNGGRPNLTILFSRQRISLKLWVFFVVLKLFVMP